MYARFGTRQILFKLEATEGVDPTPTGLLNAFLTFNAALSIEVDTPSRMPDRPFFTAEDKIEVGGRAKISFEADLLGAATAGNASPISPLLQGLGFAEVLTAGTKADYNPITNGILSATFYFYQAGMLWKATGARGDLTIDRDPQNFGKATFTFTGVYDQANPISQTAIPTIDVSAFRPAPPIVPSNWLVSLNGINVECVKHQIKLGNSVQYIPTSENGRVLITDRKAEGTLSILLPDLATINPWALAYARTRVPIVDVVDGGATLKSTINLPTCQLMLSKGNVNIKGGTQIDIPYIAYPNAGNDEIQFEFA